MTPRLSIIVPNYNHAGFLRQRIESILRQTYQQFELILLDDCSTDDSRNILTRYSGDPRVQLEFNESNSGSTFKQWNRGMRRARGEYVWIAESDDYADEHLLERLLAILEADADIVFAYCRAWCVTDSGPSGFVDRYYANLHPTHWTQNFIVEGIDECSKYLVQCNTITNTSGVVFRRKTYEAVGGADESLCLCGDWKLWAAMALTGKIAYIADPLNYLRFHGTTVRNKSSQDGLDIAEYLQVIRWILGRVNPDSATLEQVYANQARWVAAILSLRVPFARKRSILRNVVAIDPHPFQGALRPALTTIGRKFMRHWRDVRSLITPNKDDGR